MKYLLMIVLLFTVTQVWAAAQGGEVKIDVYVTGDRLLVWCDGYIDAFRNGKPQAHHGNCAGYIAGLVDAHNNHVGWGDMKASFCMPDGVKFGQVVRVVTKRLKEYPETYIWSLAALSQMLYLEPSLVNNPVDEKPPHY